MKSLYTIPLYQSQIPNCDEVREYQVSNIVTDPSDAGVSLGFDDSCVESPCRTLAIDVTKAYKIKFDIKVITKLRSFYITHSEPLSPRMEVIVGTSA